MSLISLPYIFTAGTTIIASQTNANNTTFLNAINGGLDNTNFTGSAGITYANLSLSGDIVNSDISTGANIATSKINFGTANQGDIFVDEGSGITRLTPGTSGQFLQTQGASANPQWATITTANTSNVLFQYQGFVDTTVSTLGETEDSSLTPDTPTKKYRYLFNTTHTGGAQLVWSTYYIHVAGISTITIYTRLWSNNSSGNASLYLFVDDVSATYIEIGTGITSPAWGSFTYDASGLTPGTAYTMDFYLWDEVGSYNAYCATIMGFGS